MIRLRWSFIYFVIVIFAGLSMASSEDDVDKKVTKLFEINWESMRYNKSVTQYNPKIASNRQASRATESLTLSCEVMIKDPNMVLGTLREGIITEITVSKKRNVEVSQELPPEKHAVNCGAIPETLLESELFGHEKGAFTGAQYRRKGKLELANGGTLFLDEIGDISFKMQIDLLRVLEGKRFTRLGGSEEISVDFRLICATNKNLEKLVEEEKFRAATCRAGRRPCAC